MITDEIRVELIKEALEARSRAYAPYSRYTVGAAILAASGRIYNGVNVENAAYPSSMCAERVALFKAVSEGERELIAVAVATANGGAPCGSCRQVLSEFGYDMQVFIADGQGNIIQEASLQQLLPGAFGPQDLPGRTGK